MAVSSYKEKQMIVMRRDLKMRKGKIAAQAGHACVEAVLMALTREGRLDQVRIAPSGGWVYLDEGTMPPTPLADWFSAGVAKVCVYVDSEEALLDLANKGRELGFRVLQFNAVVESNTHARHLYERLGFVPLGIIPGGFRMKDGHYENICPYYHEL